MKRITIITVVAIVLSGLWAVSIVADDHAAFVQAQRGPK